MSLVTSCQESELQSAWYDVFSYWFLVGRFRPTCVLLRAYYFGGKTCSSFNYLYVLVLLYICGIKTTCCHPPRRPKW